MLTEPGVPEPEEEKMPEPEPAPTPRRRSRASITSGRRGRMSVSFQMFKEMEFKEEYQKLRLAGFLRELHKLAKEEEKEKIRESMQELPAAQGANRKQRRKSSFFGNQEAISLEGIELTELDKETAFDKIEQIFKGRGQGEKKLTLESLIQLAQASVQVLGEQETLVDLRDKNFKTVTVVGDLHGSLDCLHCVLEMVGLDRSGTHKKENQVVIFGGDYVDRGEHSLEVISTLLLLKLSHPDTVHLLRGNHEDTMTASIYGFRDEIDEKYGDPDIVEDVWYEFGLVFAAFPIAAWTKSAAIMHGGIPSMGFQLERIREIDPDVRVQLKTVVDPYDEDEEVVQGVMWSDPTTDPGIEENDRGGGSLFGPDVTEQFLNDHDLKLVIRAHEPCEEGTDHQDLGDGRGVVTVFSASNYPNGEGTNLGAVLHLDDETGNFEAMTFDSSEDNSGHKQDESDQYHTVLNMAVEHNRSRLTKAFRQVEDSEGCITPDEWAEIVGRELELPDVDWLQLQETLAPATDGKIKWLSFLHKYSKSLPNKDAIGDDQLSILHENKEKFLSIFQILDVDGSGTIDQAEFVTGIKKLNEETGEGAQLTNPEKLFSVFDIDGDGEISIEEFCKGLEQSAVVKGVTDALDTTQVESLQENHEMLLLAFKYLDTDKSGAIDREEFSRGIELLNKRLPERNKLGDADELFDLLDADGSGEIDMNEFNQMFSSI